MNQSESTVVPKGRQVNRPLPSREYLHECLRYDGETGLLYWKIRPRHHFPSQGDCTTWNKRWALKLAGNECRTPRNNYMMIGLRHDGNNGMYRAHRVIYKMVKGEFDESLEIDHEDRNQLNNRIENLRPATRTQNHCNSRAKRTDWPKGVHPIGKRFKALITIKGKTHYLGTFDTPDEARDAYRMKHQEIAGEFARY